MSAVSISSADFLDNPSSFLSPIRLHVKYECLRPLQEDLQFQLVYVGSADSSEFDQILEDVSIGPVEAGSFQFILEAEPPEPDKIPEKDILGASVIFLACSYRGTRFVQVGYYVNNEYADEQMQQEPPEKVQVDKIVRNILADNPRVTRFQIAWDDEVGAAAAAEVADGEDSERAEQGMPDAQAIADAMQPDEEQKENGASEQP